MGGTDRVEATAMTLSTLEVDGGHRGDLDARIEALEEPMLLVSNMLTPAAPVARLADLRVV